jgi:hypothetical protein
MKDTQNESGTETEQKFITKDKHDYLNKLLIDIQSLDKSSVKALTELFSNGPLAPSNKDIAKENISILIDLGFVSEIISGGTNERLACTRRGSNAYKILSAVF